MVGQYYESVHDLIGETNNIEKGQLIKTYKGITLDEPISSYLDNDSWTEVRGIKKLPYKTPFLKDRIFIDANRNIMLGFVKERLYKISVLFERPPDLEVLVNIVSNFCGNPRINSKGRRIWEDDDTTLELIPHKSAINIITTDRRLIQSALSD